MNSRRDIKTGTILDAICEKKREEIEFIPDETYRKWVTQFSSKTLNMSSKFANALTSKEIAVIAEIKKASPSEGIIRENPNPKSIANAYKKNGAAAISVVTDESFFKGQLKWIGEIKNAVPLPVIRKDFILDRKQVYESKSAGADAILLIAAILDESSLKELYDLAYSLGMEVLVEIHNRQELEMALNAGAEIIGINNRNLENFKVGKETFISLAAQIPNDKIVVAESGIHSKEDVLLFKAHGADAVLVGTHLMRDKDPGKALNQLIGTAL